MSEFKITHETTLYSLQEFCKLNECASCALADVHFWCMFKKSESLTPADWGIARPKTYKEDFLEKFPNARMECGVPVSCRLNIYADDEKCCFECAKCWNEIMEE